MFAKSWMFIMRYSLFDCKKDTLLVSLKPVEGDLLVS